MAIVGAVMNGIGLGVGAAGLALQIIDFALGNLPKNSAPQGATVRIKAGLGDQNSYQLGGGFNHVDCYDYNNKITGWSGGGNTNGDGGVVDLVCNQRTPGVQAHYITVQNSDDATCIAWIAVKQYDGADNSGGSWTGDIGRNCGIQWYYGNQVAGRYKDGKDYMPHCAWLDADHTNDIKYGSMKINLRAYGERANDTLQNNKACQSTIWQVDSTGIDPRPAKRETGKIQRRQWIQERLIISDIEHHTAAELCMDENSYGPDFVGSDGYFCDMETKTLLPLCSTENVAGCVTLDVDGMSISNHSSPIGKFSVASAGDLLHKYQKVTQW